MLYTSYRSTTRGRRPIRYGRWFVDNVAELIVSCFLLSLADAATLLATHSAPRRWRRYTSYRRIKLSKTNVKHRTNNKISDAKIVIICS